MGKGKQSGEERDRRRRLAWFKEARFGMFIHWGLYSVLGRHEWVMNRERIPVREYEPLADRFKPRGRPARRWAALAKEAGQRYMVMTTKHHEGFCLFDTATTDYCAPRCAAGRDLVADYIEAAREQDMRVGLYFSLLDWHHPDGARCVRDERARRRFVKYTHDQVRELMSNYGKIDILWYDMPWPLDAKGWESKKLNAMARRLQPDILINNRARLPEDFSTPEQKVQAAGEGRAFEACMTMNRSWGYNRGDNAWKTPRELLRHLGQAARFGGNYLLNIGPTATGRVPTPSVHALRRVGDWLQRNGEAVYGTEPCDMEPMHNVVGLWTRKGKRAYLHCHAWPGTDFALGGLRGGVRRAWVLGTGQKLRFQRQRGGRIVFEDVPQKAPDTPVTVIAFDFNSKPRTALGHGMVVPQR